MFQGGFCRDGKLQGRVCPHWKPGKLDHTPESCREWLHLKVGLKYTYLLAPSVAHCLISLASAWSFAPSCQLHVVCIQHYRGRVWHCKDQWSERGHAECRLTRQSIWLSQPRPYLMSLLLQCCESQPIGHSLLLVSNGALDGTI